MSGSDLFAEYEPTARRAVWDGGVRLARTVDIEAVTALAVARDGGDPGAKAERFRSHVDSVDNALHAGTVAADIIGYGLTRTLTFEHRTAPDGLYLGGVVIDPAWRRRGLGHALTAIRIAWARERTDVVWYVANEHNRASIDLHARFGFEEYARDFEIPGVIFTGGEGICSDSGAEPSI